MGPTPTAMVDPGQDLKISFPCFMNEKMQNAPLGDISNDIHTERSNNKISFLEDKLRKADEILRENALEMKHVK